MQLIKNQSKIVTEELPPLCRYTDDCSNNLCQFRHDTRSKSKSQTSEDQDIFKHVMTSTPIRLDILKNVLFIFHLDTVQLNVKNVKKMCLKLVPRKAMMKMTPTGSWV